MSSDDHSALIQGLAALAIGWAEMGYRGADLKAAIRQQLDALGERDPGLVVNAAAAVRSMPQPLDETVADPERAEQIRQMLGLASAHDQLEAMLAAREALEDVARELR